MTFDAVEVQRRLIVVIGRFANAPVRASDTLHHDLKIAGDDVDNLFRGIAAVLLLLPIGWGRFFDLNEPPGYIRGKARDRECVTIAHPADVIAEGAWFEP